jgi:hypothetical protein
MSGRRGASRVALTPLSDRSLFPSDRRLARGYQTKIDLVDATIELWLGGNPHPTTRQVAECAEVSWRTFFNHFRIDLLYGVAAATQVLRSLGSITPVPAQGPLSIRIKATCGQRRWLFEQIAAVLDAVPSRPAVTPLLDDALDDLAALLAHQLKITFAREISRRSDGSNLVEALDVPTGWEVWIILRLRRHLTPNAAERQLAATMSRLLQA